ncbi:hypothetical protein NDU88_010288 [Pleurodeles waltl]|uniref:Uncharacterized protein n=1 Tax=Pleurodeles waltl TaxID=8319 RepID=A0AAV7PZN1_PLEWA|nr:hypothetical protein NDU88_010288 [Pleurodeles waltl]
MFPGAQSVYSRFNLEEPDIYHMVWDCRKVTPYWESPMALRNFATGCNLERTLIIFLLGLFPKPTERAVNSKFTDLILTRRHISIIWKSSVGPSLLEWRQELSKWEECDDAIMKLEV